MATTTMEERLKEIGRRIDRLQEAAKAAHGRAKASAQARIDTLRKQEASMRSAVEQEASTKKEEVEDRLEELETKVKVTRHSIEADAADDARSFSDAVSKELHVWDAYFDRVQERLGARADSALAELRTRREAIGEQLDAIRTSGGESWQKLRTRVDEERAELSGKADTLAERLHTVGRRR